MILLRRQHPKWMWEQYVELMNQKIIDAENIYLKINEKQERASQNRNAELKHVIFKPTDFGLVKALLQVRYDSRQDLYIF